MKTSLERRSESSDALSFREILAFLSRQKFVLLVCLGIGLLAWGAAITFIPPEYRVYTSFTVDAKQANGTTSNDAFAELAFPDQVGDILTAIQVMQGEEVLGEAFRTAGVVTYRVGDEYLGGPKVDISQVGYTNLIQVTLDGPKPDQMLSIAKDIPVLFAATTRRVRDQAINQAILTLQSRQRAAAADVQKASDAVSSWDTQISLKAGSNDPSEIASRRNQAMFTMETAKAELEAARERLQSLQLARAAVPKLIRNPAQQSSTARRNQLTDELNRLRVTRAEQAVIYTESSPQIRALDAQIRTSEAAIKAIPEIDRTTTVTRNPQLDLYDDKVAEATAGLRSAEARLDKSTAFFNEVQGQTKVLTNLVPKRTQLQNAVVEAQKSLDLINTRLSDLQVRKNALRDPVAVVVPPSQEPAPVRPRPILYLAIAVIMSSVLGLSLASLKEHLDDRIISPELAARETGAIVLGLVPPMRGRERLTLVDPRMPRRYADAVRLVHQRIETIFGLGSELELRSLMLTSMSRAEERSSVARNLASAYAAEGRSVILVAVGNTSILDDLGGYTSKTGYSDLLNDPSAAESALVPAGIENVRAITRGSGNTPLTTAHIALVHQRLSNLADIVIYDGPSYLFPFDVQSLGGVVDSTVIVVKPGVPKRTLLGVASETLRGLRSHFLGIVISGSTTEEASKEIVRFAEEPFTA